MFSIEPPKSKTFVLVTYSWDTKKPVKEKIFNGGKLYCKPA